jgi:DNA-binding response OmpR family regulator
MGSEAPSFLRTLVVEARPEHGHCLAEQLNRAGFKTDLAASWVAARALLRSDSPYHSCVVFADLEQPVHLDQLGKLRRQTPSVWLIVLSHLPMDRALPLARAQGVDAVLAEPFSLQDLVSRLTALSIRSRPLF